MDRYQAVEKSKSFLFATKSFRKNSKSLAQITIGLSTTLICAVGSAQANSFSNNSPYFAEQLTFIGSNANPAASPDGKKLLFQSRDRIQHKDLQVYEYDLTSRKERRITFSDGNAFDPIFLNEKEIVYASTTDEIKEDPFGPRSPLKVLPSDLYLSDLYGNSIERLIKQPGYDAEPFFKSHPRSNLIFTSARGEVLGIYQLNLKTLAVSLISAEKGREKQSPSYSPDHLHYAWKETSNKDKNQDLIVMNTKTKVPRTVKTSDSQILGVSFLSTPPNRLIYGLSKNGKSSIEIFDIEKNCAQVVHSENAILSAAQVIPGSPSRIVFAKELKGRSQLYIKTLPDDLGPCN